MQNETSYLTVRHPSVGVAPSGFQRLHVEIMPREIGRMVGYDPRVLVMKPPRRAGRGTRDLVPKNVSPKIIDLQNKVQRSIDGRRVAGMTEYLVNAMERGTFADWGAIELVTADEPDLTDMEEAHVVHLASDADYFIADGQHRYCALLDFVSAHPQYADRFTQELTISVLPEDRLEEFAGQEFHDRNYFPVLVRPGKALSVDYREPVTNLVRELYQHPVVIAGGGIAADRDTIMARDPRFTTLSVLHRFVRAFLAGRPGLDRGEYRGEISPAAKERLWDYLSRLGEVMPWRADVPYREEYLGRASVVLSGLAVLGWDLYNSNGYTPDQVTAAIERIGKIDWHRTNLSLVGVIGSERAGAEGQSATVSPSSGRQAIDATIRFLRERVGIRPHQVSTPDNAATTSGSSNA